MPINRPCPSCGSAGMSVFYEFENAPVHSVLRLPTREEALNYPKGDITLGFCQTCGFISNVAFDPALHEYSAQYDATQAFSPTFNAFHQGLATRLIERYNLRGMDIIEIGCGQGEFLTLLCELGENRGVGFDPAYKNGFSDHQGQTRLRFIPDFYSEKYVDYECDFLCCKMTLEHIWSTADFVRTVRRSIGDRFGTTVFFQVPDVTRILRELAFWDIYYEHCSYFSPGSLARLFRKCGFSVTDLWKDYDDQYLMLEARPGVQEARPLLEQENDLEALAQNVACFSENCRHKLDKWQEGLQQIRSRGWRSVVWGAGSKAVAFLTSLNIRDQIEYAVDINPRKHGTYLAGTGQQIVGPQFLKDYEPDVVIVMNPIYCDEIQQALNRMGVAAKLLPV